MIFGRNIRLLAFRGGHYSIYSTQLEYLVFWGRRLSNFKMNFSVSDLGIYLRRNRLLINLIFFRLFYLLFLRCSALVLVHWEWYTQGEQIIEVKLNNLCAHFRSFTVKWMDIVFLLLIFPKCSTNSWSWAPSWCRILEKEMDMEGALGENVASEKSVCRDVETCLGTSVNQRVGAIPAATHSACAACDTHQRVAASAAYSRIATFQKIKSNPNRDKREQCGY